MSGLWSRHKLGDVSLAGHAHRFRLLGAHVLVFSQVRSAIVDAFEQGVEHLLRVFDDAGFAWMSLI